VSAALPAPPLLLITDRLSTAADLREVIQAALEGGCRWIMVREKDLDREALTALAAGIVALARPFDACVVVNGDAEIAQAAQAAGAHVQSVEALAAARVRLGANALIGVSAHTLAEAEEAAAAGADYVTISPVFMTESKPGYGPALGLEGLATVCRAVACPVLALAGVAPDNAGACLKAGAAGVAVMGGIMRAEDPAERVRGFVRTLSGTGSVSDRG
jgi:thiamine-phosphate pyrophosphorylase